MDCQHCEYETNCELPCIFMKERAVTTRVKDKKLLEAYRFVFSRNFVKNKELISALEDWQPDIYKLILSDTNSES